MLSSSVCVNPEDVQELLVPERSQYVSVRMRDGSLHLIAAEYGKSVHDKFRQLKEELEGLKE